MRPSCLHFIILHGSICILCICSEHSDRSPSLSLYMLLPGLWPPAPTDLAAGKPRSHFTAQDRGPGGTLHSGASQGGCILACIVVLSTVWLFLHPPPVTLPQTSGVTGMRGYHTHLSVPYQQLSNFCKPAPGQGTRGRKGVTAPHRQAAALL